MKYIKDGKTIRKCDINLRQMNTFEYMYCEIFHWNYFQKAAKFILEMLIKILKSLTKAIYGLLILLLNIILIIFTPITLFIIAKKELKEAKKR